MEMTESIAPTELAYFQDMCRFHSKATFIAAVQEGDRLALILNCTIFHPQGGGQPADHGWILDTKEELKFCVEDVRMKNDLVYHYGFYRSATNAVDAISNFYEGQEVHLMVNESRRKLNSRLHSAGHLLDVCMRNVGLDFEAGKGYHFPDGSFVEYKGVISPDEVDLKRSALQAEVNRLVFAGGMVRAVIVPYDEAVAMCGGKLPDYISKDIKPRIVCMGENPGCPCGGTHVLDISEIGNVKVLQMRVKKGMTKVSYSLSP